jgi:hypothetical protein
MLRSNAPTQSSFSANSNLDAAATKVLAGLFMVLAPLMAVYSLADSHEPENIVQLERVVITADRIDTAQAPLNAARRDRS